jgi:hypothetical protein
MNGPILAKDPRPTTLVEALDRLIERGVFATGDITVSVAGVDLLTIGLDVLIAAVERAAEFRGRRLGAETRP